MTPGPPVDPATFVATLTYKPGWTFKIGGPGRRMLCIFATTPDSLRPAATRTTQHQFALPEEPLDRRAFARWVFELLLLAELHEAGEFFATDGHRPFFPHHQEEGSPYDLPERWPDNQE